MLVLHSEHVHMGPLFLSLYLVVRTCSALLGLSGAIPGRQRRRRRRRGGEVVSWHAAAAPRPGGPTLSPQSDGRPLSAACAGWWWRSLWCTWLVPRSGGSAARAAHFLSGAGTSPETQPPPWPVPPPPPPPPALPESAPVVRAARPGVPRSGSLCRPRVSTSADDGPLTPPPPRRG